MNTKKLLTTLAILASLISSSQARFFLGLEGGYVYSGVDESREDSKSCVDWVCTITKPGYHIKNAYSSNGYLINLNLGNEYHFDNQNKFGIRWIGLIGYGNANIENKKGTLNLKNYSGYLVDLAIGADILFDILRFDKKNTFGFFVGVEADVRVLNSKKNYLNSNGKYYFPVFNSFSLRLVPRFGLSLFLNDHYRIELIGKIPAYSKCDGSGQSEEEYRMTTSYDAMLSYKYIF
ncbi:outer membrane beta-barrel protein [Helicobacter sp. 11S02596-1]|uniref:outer membrane beta-barrel protein n=1 Tax=Helicobacter sp. 11S02596-1 TaxID=1476194 RepID=UPI000BA7460F|nr:outer membrane beta-barrel protein [Helicobacter sp. 11S02596-1]PAF42088.1 hypothetical protein BJI48_07185 [Helicobacter sp. 11S02596-1]